MFICTIININQFSAFLKSIRVSSYLNENWCLWTACLIMLMSISKNRRFASIWSTQLGSNRMPNRPFKKSSNSDWSHACVDSRSEWNCLSHGLHSCCSVIILPWSSKVADFSHGNLWNIDANTCMESEGDTHQLLYIAIRIARRCVACGNIQKNLATFWLDHDRTWSPSTN